MAFGRLGDLLGRLLRPRGVVEAGIEYQVIRLADVGPRRARMPRRVPGNGLFRARQPRKLCVQNVNGFGGGFPRYRAWRHGWARCRHPRAAGALIAAVGPAAAGTQAAQLLGGFVEQDIGVFGHDVLPGTTFMAHGEGTQQVASADTAQIPTIQRRCASKSRSERSENPPHHPVPFGLRVCLDTAADASRPGHVPTHDALCSGDASDSALAPTSAITWGAESIPQPGISVSRCTASW